MAALCSAGIRAVHGKYVIMGDSDDSYDFSRLDAFVEQLHAGYQLVGNPFAAASCRPPHLRSWRDGWRHLRFLLLFSPRSLFLYPGFVLFTIGCVAMAWLLSQPRQL
jgi:hypothetical protein